MPVSFVCSQRSCQAEALWGFGPSRSCFFSPMWESEGHSSKLTSFIDHLEITQPWLCFQHAGLMSPLLGWRTVQGQTKGRLIPAICPPRLQCYFLCYMMFEVWPSRHYRQVPYLMEKGRLNSLSVVCVTLPLSCAAWFIPRGMLREPCWATQRGGLQR